VVSVILMAALGAVGIAARPASGDDRARLGEIRAREQQVRVTLDLVLASDSTVQAEAARLERAVSTEEALVASDRSAADAAALRVGAASQRIDDLTRRGDAAHQAIIDRAVELYEHPLRTEQLVLSGARSFDDLVTRQVLANAVQSRTSDLLDAVRSQRAEELAARADLARAQAEADGRRDAALGEQARLQVAESSAQRAHDELASRIHDLRVETAGLAAQESALQSTLDGRSRQYAAEVAALQASGAGLVWPMSGPVTREFGNQLGGYHPGIDIAAPDGTPIAAPGDGVVIYAGWASGYGNYTCIDHGSDISSCYGHQSSIAVRVGQAVHRGDIIGREGSTGNSTGPHLHLEVRVGGAVQNPRSFIPGQP